MSSGQSLYEIKAKSNKCRLSYWRLSNFFFERADFKSLLLRRGSTKLRQIRGKQDFIIAASDWKLWYR